MNNDPNLGVREVAGQPNNLVLNRKQPHQNRGVVPQAPPTMPGSNNQRPFVAQPRTGDPRNHMPNPQNYVGYNQQGGDLSRRGTAPPDDNGCCIS